MYRYHHFGKNINKSKKGRKFPMEKNRYLNIKGANLEKEQLNKYITQIAEEHIISKHSDKDTYPIGKLKENFEIILDTYEILNEHLKLGIKIHSAGEWILDNFYIIEETVKIGRAHV